MPSGNPGELEAAMQNVKLPSMRELDLEEKDCTTRVCRNCKIVTLEDAC
jgi:hypothetical protein